MTNRYKKRINNFIDQMMEDGADQDQVLNALTRCTINFMKRVRKSHNEDML